MRIVFWNTNKNENINEYISDIIVEQEIDILVLAEYESDIEELKKMLALYNIVIEQAITIGCDRITILKRKENIQPAFQNKYCSMQIIDDMYLLVCLHLPSKLYADVLKRGIAIARIVEEIQIHEEKLGIIYSFCHCIVLQEIYPIISYDNNENKRGFYAELLTAIMLDILLYHEIGHIVNGHIDYIKDKEILEIGCKKIYRDRKAVKIYVEFYSFLYIIKVTETI